MELISVLARRMLQGLFYPRAACVTILAEAHGGTEARLCGPLPYWGLGPRPAPYCQGRWSRLVSQLATRWGLCVMRGRPDPFQNAQLPLLPLLLPSPQGIIDPVCKPHHQRLGIDKDLVAAQSEESEEVLTPGIL